MYVDASPDTVRPSDHTPRRRPLTAAARRARLADAIVSQWLLEQVPSDHRHALRDVSDQRRRLASVG
jgi:hypothetical protein